MSVTVSEPDPQQNPSAGRTERNGCTYCGLPAFGTVDANSAIYCCYGCRFAHAVAQEQGEVGATRWVVIRLGLAIFFTMNLMAFSMTMWSLDVYDVEPDPFQLTLFEVFRWLSMLLALPVLLLLGLPMLKNAVDSWQRRDYSTDLLIGLAVAAAYLTSVINVVRESGTIYFEVGATVLVMVTLGRWIEATGKQKATESLDSLLTLLPETAEVVARNDSGNSDWRNLQPETIDSTDVCIGDRIRIRAGERFPTDAVIDDGHTTVDEQIFTGESEPVARSAGDSVLAGTVNLDGDIIVAATARFKEGSFGRLLQTLQDARKSSGYYQRLAERVAAWFFPLVVAIAVGAFLFHASAGISVAIHIAMSVLLIACPCALGLATPLAVWTALSTAARHQVLFRSGESLERLAGIDVVCFDKTGTLTTGTPRVFQTAFFGNVDQDHVTELSCQLADSSSHPFSRAVKAYAKLRGFERQNETAVRKTSLTERFDTFRTISGGGVEARTTDGTLVRLGSIEFACCKLQSDETTPRDALDFCVNCRASVSLETRVQLDRLRMAADQQSASVVLLSINRVPAAGFLISESIREEAQSALQQLTGEVKALHVLSGDRAAKGRFLQAQLQVPGLNVECRLSPEKKVARIVELRRSDHKTVMVGDGINDAPALAASDVGIAMGCGADVSRDSAQVCLLGNDLTQIPWAINLARRTTSIIHQNLFWAFGYNTVGVCLAASGMLNPAISAGLMIISSLLVISNSLRLLKDDSSDISSSKTTEQLLLPYDMRANPDVANAPGSPLKVQTPEVSV